MTFPRRASLGALLASAVMAITLIVATSAVSSTSLDPQINGYVTVRPTNRAFVQSGSISMTATLASQCPTTIDPAQIVFTIGAMAVTPTTLTDVTTSTFTFTMGSNSAPSNNSSQFGNVALTCSDSTTRSGTFSFGEALVTKTVSGSVTSGTSFVIHAECTYDPPIPSSVQSDVAAISNYSFDLTVQAGGSASVFAAYLHTTCIFSEPDAKGATVAISPTSVAITQPQLYPVSVTNTFPTTTTSTSTTIAPPIEESVDPPRFAG